MKIKPIFLTHRSFWCPSDRCRRGGRGFKPHPCGTNQEEIILEEKEGGCQESRDFQ